MIRASSFNEIWDLSTINNNSKCERHLLLERVKLYYSSVHADAYVI